MSWLNELSPMTRTLDFSQRPISASVDSWYHIPRLNNFPNLVRLDLSNNRELISVHFEYIGEILCNFPSFQELVIKKVEGVDLIHLLHPLVVTKKQLRVLNLSGTRFQAPVQNELAAVHLGMAIREQRNLEVLKLPDYALTHFKNPFSGPIGGWFLGATSLRSLSLGYQPDLEPDTKLNLMRALIRLTKLEHLALGGAFRLIDIEDAEREAVANLKYVLSKLTLITSFSLKNAYCSVGTCVELASALPNYTNLTSLNLSGTIINNDEVQELQPLFKSTPYLTKLDLSKIHLEATSRSVFFHTLAPLTELRTLKLNETKLTRSGGVIRFARFNTNLTRLELERNRFPEKVTNNIINRLPQMKSVGDLRLVHPMNTQNGRIKELCAFNRHNHLMKTGSLLNFLMKDLKPWFDKVDDFEAMFKNRGIQVFTIIQQ